MGLGASGPWTTPFDYGVWGLNGRFGPFRPPTASMLHGPWAVGPISPLLAQRGQVGKTSSPDSRWVSNHNRAYLSLFWPKAQEAQNDQKPKFAIIDNLTEDYNHVLWKGPAAQKSFNKGLPLAQSNGFKPAGTNCGAYKVSYTIMHHFFSGIKW
ncbi:hypothetical protein O181_027850 [Austropuccinia psidii MF-1]|uniref:Uncharacterized protein n=1 Tax=Austropuccinia psidii MF-1 TaxID=1389203 RepID=A0A9Q3CS58_9BASI|nr:hypothetical protein [Austropuccinia psidii MF-1]